MERNYTTTKTQKAARASAPVAQQQPRPLTSLLAETGKPTATNEKLYEHVYKVACDNIPDYIGEPSHTRMSWRTLEVIERSHSTVVHTTNVFMEIYEGKVCDASRFDLAMLAFETINWNLHRIGYRLPVAREEPYTTAFAKAMKNGKQMTWLNVFDILDTFYIPFGK